MNFHRLGHICEKCFSKQSKQNIVLEYLFPINLTRVLLNILNKNWLLLLFLNTNSSVIFSIFVPFQFFNIDI